MKRRWTLRFIDARTGETQTLIIAVTANDGVVHSSVGTGAIALGAEDVSRLRRMLLEAQAVALHDQGCF